MVINVEGIIVSSKNYGDTSKIVDIFTKEYGIIGVIAKGCRNLKSNLRSVTDNLSYANFTIYYKKEKLSTLSEASIINNFSNIKKDIEKISYASYIMDLSKQVYKQNEDSGIFDILIETLIKINEKLNPLILTNILELKLLDYLGVMPSLDGCSICGNKNIITLSLDIGGFLCRSCISSNDIVVSDKVLKLIRMYYYVDIKKIEKLEINIKLVDEINKFLDMYYDKYTGLYLKTKNFIKNLEKL